MQRCDDPFLLLKFLRLFEQLCLLLVQFSLYLGHLILEDRQTIDLLKLGNISSLLFKFRVELLSQVQRLFLTIFRSPMFRVLQDLFVSLMKVLLGSIVFAVILVFKLNIHFEGILRDDGKVVIVAAVFIFFWGVEGRMRELDGMNELSRMLMAVILF